MGVVAGEPPIDANALLSRLEGRTTLGTEKPVRIVN